VLIRLLSDQLPAWLEMSAAQQRTSIAIGM
jgi:hypothetical protein